MTATAMLPVGRTNRMTRQLILAAVSGTIPGITLVAFAFMTGYERNPGNSEGWWIVAGLCLLCAGNSVLGVTIVRRHLRRELLLVLPLVPLSPVVISGFLPKWQVLLIPAVVVWFAGALSAFVASSSLRKAPSS
jgi:hypothetical protein